MQKDGIKYEMFCLLLATVLSFFTIEADAAGLTDEEFIIIIQSGFGYRVDNIEFEITNPNVQTNRLPGIVFENIEIYQTFYNLNVMFNGIYSRASVALKSTQYPCL